MTQKTEKYTKEKKILLHYAKNQFAQNTNQTLKDWSDFLKKNPSLLKKIYCVIKNTLFSQESLSQIPFKDHPAIKNFISKILPNENEIFDISKTKKRYSKDEKLKILYDYQKKHISFQETLILTLEKYFLKYVSLTSDKRKILDPKIKNIFEVKNRYYKDLPNELNTLIQKRQNERLRKEKILLFLKHSLKKHIPFSLKDYSITYYKGTFGLIDQKKKSFYKVCSKTKQITPCLYPKDLKSYQLWEFLPLEKGLDTYKDYIRTCIIPKDFPLETQKIDSLIETYTNSEERIINTIDTFIESLFKEYISETNIIDPYYTFAHITKDTNDVYYSPAFWWLYIFFDKKDLPLTGHQFVSFRKMINKNSIIFF